jgi:hypothetical protein
MLQDVKPLGYVFMIHPDVFSRFSHIELHIL